MRSARRAGSTVSVAARSRNAAAAARPPASLRPARGALELRCDVLVRTVRGLGEMPDAAVRLERPVGHLRQRACTLWRSASRGRSVDRRAHKRMPEAHLRTRRPAGPSAPRDRAQSPRSPAGSPPATSAPGRRPVRRPRPGAAGESRRAAPPAAAGSSPRFAPTAASNSGSPNPPANCVAESPRGSSSSASGLPRVSATIRSRTRSSSRPGIAVASRARASSSPSPRSAQLRQADQLALVGRLPHSEHDRHRLRQQPARDEPEHLAEAASSHWASSTKQSSGRSSVTSARRLSAASATRKRGASPDSMPRATFSASCCGSGNAPRRSSIGLQSRCNPAKGSSISDSTPAICSI